MPIVWQDSFLNSLSTDAENDIVEKIDYLFTRFTLSVTSGQSVYTLPSYTRSIQRITWKGKKVYPISFREMCEISPSTMVADETNKIESATSIPYYYCLHPNNIRNIRFYPTPNETVGADDTKVWDRDDIDDVVIISAYRNPDDDTFALPSYLSRRTKKAFVLREAFTQEGKGQNLVASKYYDQKYNFLVEAFRRINDGAYVSRRLRLSENRLTNLGRRPAHPVFPANYCK